MNSNKETTTKANKIVKSLLSSSLDGRTLKAKSLYSMRKLMEDDHLQTTACLLRDQIAAYGVAQSILLIEIAKGKNLLKDNELSPLFNELKKCETSILALSKRLQAITAEQDQKPVKEVNELSVSAILLEHDND